MRRYDYEIDEVEFDPERAQRAINAILADARADPEHPLHRRDHPQHADTLTTLTRLQEMANPALPPAAPLSDDERQEVEARIKELEATPGFADGTLRRENRAEHERIVVERASLYSRLFPGVEENGEEAPPDDEGGGDEGWETGDVET